MVGKQTIATCICGNKLVMREIELGKKTELLYLDEVALCCENPSYWIR